ncbi:hypothetical protein [Bacillus norwichensis]|uniref:Fur-regulated basic protein FbpA n=1 Tax=Bacillus norwichensis TaxID=2762217 RepID=A0ABR8VKH4_9BACI|nr:hypothetical protein [Bacillus norwichensis]MBD8005263.1 hypothetical protein [Bacillus norwichensis]
MTEQIEKMLISIIRRRKHRLMLEEFTHHDNFHEINEPATFARYEQLLAPGIFIS